MSGFALYREPGKDSPILLRQHEGSPRALHTYATLTGERGFVFAPFNITRTTPLLLIEGTPRPAPSEKDLAMAARDLEVCLRDNDRPESSRQSYADDFQTFHHALTDHTFEKLVLSRSMSIPNTHATHPFALFERACRAYPQQFVALVATPVGGTWLMATPEILLRRDGHDWQTMALAGTMPAGQCSEWSEKNIREQQYVTAFIRDILQKRATDIRESPPRTVRAGSVKHLQSDFRFTLSPATPVGDLLETLHPTPAVCGLPKEPAREFILTHEQSDRRYYAGFTGPLEVENSTALYVSLRCMELFADSCRLYAGGGLLDDSREEQEWEETAAKMQTMKSLLYV
ncbi:MAG: isochorismate synthase [Prevotellaceae bacterium]|nr:isochorismate synthase [Prevotellaceae bacterium]MDY2634131.1 isochorismate synthase [Prevotella sp.]